MKELLLKNKEKNCKKIARIPTDQGYTCSLNPILYTRDAIKIGGFYLDRIFKETDLKVNFDMK